MTDTIAAAHKSTITILADDGSIRLPSEMVTAMGLQAGDQLVITREDDHLIVRPYGGDLV